MRRNAFGATLVTTAFFAGSGSNLVLMSDTTVGNTMNGLEFVKEMKIGWNLGNTFDAPGETAWGNHATTREMLQKMNRFTEGE